MGTKTNKMSSTYQPISTDKIKFERVSTRDRAKQQFSSQDLPGNVYINKKSWCVKLTDEQIKLIEDAFTTEEAIQIIHDITIPHDDTRQGMRREIKYVISRTKSDQLYSRALRMLYK